MNINEVTKYLNQKVKIVVYDEIPSSNTEAKKLAINGEKEFTTVIAKRQTQGKGRLGRSFISNSENGLYMSMILRPL
ncbi:MAG: biotin--[Clostridia bacterium]|nr:biotin--[acetyl-CoA-carboxylase] ligase [Clostridia bacterium]